MAATASLAGIGFAAPAVASNASPPVTLSSEVIPGIASVPSLGPAPATQAMQLAVAVRGANPGALAQAYHAVYTPGSAGYHHFLTPLQLADQFGASTASWSATQSWLAAGGLKVTYASPTRDLLLVSGPASAVASRFGVTLQRYHAAAGDFIANTTAPAVPATLGITNVVGLNTLDRSKALVQGSSGTTAPSAPTVGSENIGTQTPQDLWGAYNQPAADEGQGTTVGMFGAGEYASIQKDLTQFEGEYKLPAVPSKVVTVGSGPFTDTSGGLEWDLDTQSEVGMAPQTSSVSMYFGSDLSDPSVLGLFDAWVSDTSGPHQMNASFGECELNPLGSAAEPAINAINSALGTTGAGIGLVDDLQAVGDPVLQKATLEGRTLFSSAGDTGSSCPAIVLPVVGAGNGVLNQVVPFTNYPATSPFVTGVGGTVLYTNGSGQSATRASEYAWTFGGGGDSLFVPAPAYQQGVKNLDLPCVSSPTGGLTGAGQLCRGVPDVSAMSGDVLTNNYPIVAAGQDSSEGGTSLSSPLWVGMWARVQGAATTAGGHGFANETIYRLGKNATTEARDFTDITTGLGGIPVVGNGAYPTLPGWDYATGWGSPDVANLITDANG